MRPQLVGIAGGSGSGKSTLAQALVERRPGACVVELDWYYLDLSHLSIGERAGWNFDHPDALDWALMIEQMRRLGAGKGVDAPVYDFATHTRGTARRAIYPAPLVVVEGILALHDAALRNALDVRIFVSAGEPVRLARRLERDVRERGRTPESVHEQFARTVRPMHEAYVEPTREHAQVIADGEGDFGSAVEKTLELLDGGVRLGPLRAAAPPP
jgi:uridine kinase